LPPPTLNHDTPFLRLFGHPPTYSNLCTFGCVCYVHLPAHERTKLTAQSIQYAFLGYSVHQKGFLCYDPNLHRIRISRNVIFLENQYFFSMHQDPVPPLFSVLPMFTNSSAAPVPSKPLLVYQRRSSATSHQPPDLPKPPHIPSSTTAPVPATATPSHRQSTRVHRPPDRYGYSLPSSITTTLSSTFLPSSYKQAIEHECWRKAIETELLALEENQT